jgi:glutathione S-transferase
VKLYYMPGACSLASHIVAKELKMELKYEKVNRDKTTETGADFMKISPTGAVPCLEIENGQVLTEGAVIMQYLCDKSDAGQAILPKAGTLERVRVQEWLNYVASEIHKGVGILFGVPRIFPEKIQADVTEGLKGTLTKKFERLERALSGKKYLFENKFSPADAYLFTVLTWTTTMKIDLTLYPGIMGFMENMHARPSVREAMKEEGLLK